MAIKGNEKEQTRSKIKVPSHYQVLIYNDDFTPMHFVVNVRSDRADAEHS